MSPTPSSRGAEAASLGALPSSEDHAIPTDDGRRLAATLFHAARPRGAVLVASAMGVPRRLYGGLATHFAEGGLTTLTFDYRGIRDSGPSNLRGYDARLLDWAERDLPAALEAFGKAEPDVPLLYFGHSVGGQLLGFVERPAIHAALFVGSQSGYWRHWSGWRRPAMWALWHLLIPAIVPVAGRLPMNAVGQGEDVPAGVALEWARWGRDPGYLMVGVRERGARGFAEFPGPLRFYALSDDGYAPPRSVEALVELYTGARGERKEYRLVKPADVGAQQIGHFGAFRPRFRDSLWTEWREWLLAQL